MIHADYDERERKLYLRPATPEGEQELREFLQQLKQVGLEAIDIETQLSREDYQRMKRQRSHQMYGKEYDGNPNFGLSPRSYMPQPPDFSPQAHYPLWPYILPFILEGRRDNNYGRLPGEGDQGGNFQNERGRDNFPGRNENPRDTGPRDLPRR